LQRAHVVLLRLENLAGALLAKQRRQRMTGHGRDLRARGPYAVFSSAPERLVDFLGNVAPGAADVVQIAVRPAGQLMPTPVALAPHMQRLAEAAEHAYVMMICHQNLW
jgi:hypothetical protein